MGHAGFDAVVIDWQHGLGVSQESVTGLHPGGGQHRRRAHGADAEKFSGVYFVLLDRRGLWGHVPMVKPMKTPKPPGAPAAMPPLATAALPPTAHPCGRPRSLCQRANDDVICLVMVETTKALENVESIAKARQLTASTLARVTFASIWGWA